MKAYSYKPIFQKTVLDNGVRVVTESHPFTRAVCIGVFVEVGSRDETVRRAGMTHFLEHLVFKGTRSRDAFDIGKVLDAVGGELNAYTTREYTCFHATSLKEHFPLALDVVAELVTSATLSREDFLKERDVILQEIQMAKDSLEEYIFDEFLEKAYAGHPLANSILGTPDTLQALQRTDVVQHYRDWFRGPQIIVSVAGPVEHDQVVDKVAKELGKLKKRSKQHKRKTPRIRRVEEFIPRPSEQVHLLVGLPSSSYKSKSRFESYVVNQLMGGGTTSRLYQRIRENKGLVYSVYSFLQSFIDSGLFLVYAGTSDKNAVPVFKAIRSEFEKFIARGLRKDELEMFKTQVKGEILLGAEDMENRMNSLGVNEMVFGRYREVDEVTKEIDEVTIDSVSDYVRKYFDLGQVSLMVMGDLQPVQALKLMQVWE